MKQKRLLLNSAALAFFIASIVAVAINPATAQDSQGPGNGFRISPVRYEMVLEKGATETITLTIDNPTNSKISADVIINDFEAGNDESGEPKVLFDPTTSVTSNSFKTIASAPKSIELEAGGRVELPVTISINKSFSAGGYYGAVRLAAINSADKNVSLSASVGTIFLVTVPGNLTEQLNLIEFTAAKNDSKGRFFINTGEMSIVTRLKNNGDIHVKPFGKIQVSDRSGRVIEEFEFNNTEPRGNILPKSTRKFTNNLKNSKWLGKYTVTANLGYGTSGSLITAKTYFWVIPLWFVVAATSLVAAIIVIAYLLYRKYKTRSFHKSSRRR